MNSSEARVFRASERRSIRIKMTNDTSKYLSKCCYCFLASNEQKIESRRNSQSKRREMNEMITRKHKQTRATGAHTLVGQTEVQSWRRSTASLVIYSLLLIALECPTRHAKGQQFTSFIRPQQHHYNYPNIQQQHQHQQQQQQQQQLSSSSSSSGVGCKIGPPVQWRPYLDASSKAYLAPVIAIATLKHFNLTPIQLAAGSVAGRGHSKNGLLDRLHSQQSMLFHAQSVNNVGVLIEATFQVKSLLRTRPMIDLRPGESVVLHYKVDASLSTTSDIIALYSGGGASEATNQQQVDQRNQTTNNQYARGHHQHLHPVWVSPSGKECALELTEKELVKRGSKLFKVNQDYALFLEQTARKRPYDRQQQQQQQTASRLAPNHYWVRAWHPFAAHEPMTNQTRRAIQKILCRGCVRAPTVQLVNSTFVSAHQDESARQQQRRAINAHSSSSSPSTTIRLDCRVSGVPAPWVEWFRNGKLLRNRPNSRMRIKTGKVQQQQQQQQQAGKGNNRGDKLSRLEIDLLAGHNETGIYECRAMSVAAREPVVGTYTLLVMPAQYALIPMQPAIGAGEDTNELDDSTIVKGQQRDKERKQFSATTVTATATATTSLSQNDRLIIESTSTTTTTAPVTVTTSAAAAPVPVARTTTPTDDYDRDTPTSTSPAPRVSAQATSSSTARPSGQLAMQRDDDNQTDDQRVQISPSQVGGGGGIQSTRRPPSSSESGTSMAPGGASTRSPSSSSSSPTAQQQRQSPSSKGRGHKASVVGQPCPGDAHDSFCLNRGTCVLIGHIEEYFCNCAEGYHGHRCEYKSLGHQQTSRK